MGSDSGRSVQYSDDNTEYRTLNTEHSFVPNQASITAIGFLALVCRKSKRQAKQRDRDVDAYKDNAEGAPQRIA